MSTVIIEGNKPLVGEVAISGSRNSSLKLLYASLLSNDDITLENVPRTDSLLSDINLIRSMGGKIEWTGNNRLNVNGSQINSYQIPVEVGSRYRTAILMAPALLFRFGKAFIPKYKFALHRENSLNRIIENWKSMGVIVEEDDSYWMLFADKMKPSSINFKTPSHMGTDIAILSASFLNGDSIISGASEESEIDDLIKFLNIIGAKVIRTNPKEIKIEGVNIFKGGSMGVQFDKVEAATFASAAVLTGGDIILKNIDRAVMIPFVNFLNKVGARFEFEDNKLKVWNHSETLQPANITISPTPGFITDWQMLATLILTQALGDSTVHDTVFFDRFDYIKDLNRMGAKIELKKPSEVGLSAFVSDDFYDLETSGEPFSVACIKGPRKLKGERLQINDFWHGAVLVLAALCAEGKSEIMGLEKIDANLENFTDKLIGLGAKIWKPEV